MNSYYGYDVYEFIPKGWRIKPYVFNFYPPGYLWIENDQFIETDRKFIKLPEYKEALIPAKNRLFGEDDGQIEFRF